MIEEHIKKKALQQAIKVLRDLNTKFYEDSSKKKPLLEDEKGSTLFLQFSLKKIPKFKSIKMIKMTLPHSLVKDDSEICLIAGDLDKRNHKAEIEPDVLHYKELLKKHDINNISEVLTLRQLRTEYKPYEAKQKLLAAYDVFLADRKIIECLPKVLGRHFFKKRKFPIQITLNTPNLKQQVEKALSTKVFYLTGLGNSCNSEVAYLDMSDEEISENIIAMAKAFCDVLPGSWDNVMGVYLKTSLSKAIPIYMSYDDPNEIFLEEEKNDNTFEIDELSTDPEKLVKVYKDGNVRTVRMKRIAQTQTSEAANSREKKMKKDPIVDDNEDNFVNTFLNEVESTKVKKKSKQEKKEKNVLEQETENSICSGSSKADTVYINEDLGKKKKRKSIVVHENVSNLVSTHLNEESTTVKKKSKGMKKEKSMLEQEIENSFWSIDKKGETVDVNEIVGKNKKKKSTTVHESISNLDDTHLNGEIADVCGKIKNKKKQKNTTVLESDHNLIEPHLNEKSVGAKKKSKGGKKEKNILEQEIESSVSSSIGGKDKKRKRKRIETVTIV